MTTTTKPNYQFRPATSADVEFIVPLVNSGYRGDSSRQGWTTEADLLVGSRIDAAEVNDLIQMPNSVILLCLQDGKIIGTVNLQLENRAVYFGLFVVRPDLQGQGTGKQFMQAAEDFARNTWNAEKSG